MKTLKHIPVSIRIFLACAAAFCPVVFFLFDFHGNNLADNTSGHVQAQEQENMAGQQVPEETSSCSTESTDAPSQTKEEPFWQSPGTYLLDGQSLEQAVAQLGTTTFRVPFLLGEIPCEYIDYDYRGGIPETVSPNRVHALTIRLNDSYFTFQLSSDTECPLKDASVTGVSETSDADNPDHLYLPGYICVGKDTGCLTGFTSSEPVFGGRKHYFTDTLGQKIIVYSKDGTITSVGIYAAD